MKKILSMGLAVTMAMAAMPTAFAADYTQGTQVEYVADADANRGYTITVPALLNPGQSGTVTLKGKWASNETVKVTADATVELTNSINSNDKKVLNIGFAGIEKAGDNTIEKTYTEAVSVAEMPASALFGTWSGKFNYNVSFYEADDERVTEPDDGEVTYEITATDDATATLADDVLTMHATQLESWGIVSGEWTVTYNGTEIESENVDYLTSKVTYQGAGEYKFAGALKRDSGNDMSATITVTVVEK